MFGYEGKTPHRICTSKQISENHVKLLLLSNSKNPFYVEFKDLDRFMTNKTKHHGKRNFLSILLTMSL